MSGWSGSGASVSQSSARGCRAIASCTLPSSSSTEKRFSIVFFFQAEDGIRDIGVTGVQTCALPILLRRDGHLDVTLQIERQYEVPEGTSATVQTVSFFGDRAVALTPSRPNAQSLEIGRASCRERV